MQFTSEWVGAIAEAVTALSVGFVGYQSWLLKRQLPLVEDQVAILKGQADLLKDQSDLSRNQVDLLRGQLSMLQDQSKTLQDQSKTLQDQLEVFHQQIVEDHERSRRAAAVDSVRVWTNSMTPENMSVQKLVEHFSADQCSCLYDLHAFKVDKRHLPLLMSCMPDEKESDFKDAGSEYELSVTQVSRLKFGVLKYLNTLESILSAWQYKVADQAIINEQFGYMLKDDPPKHTILLKYREASGLDNYPAIRAFRDKERKDRALALRQLGA